MRTLFMENSGKRAGEALSWCKRTSEMGNAIDVKNGSMPVCKAKELRMKRLVYLSEGNYSLSVPGNGEIVFSYIGYRSETLKPDGKNVLNVTMRKTHADWRSGGNRFGDQT